MLYNMHKLNMNDIWKLHTSLTIKTLRGSGRQMGYQATPRPCWPTNWPIAAETDQNFAEILSWLSAILVFMVLFGTV